MRRSLLLLVKAAISILLLYVSLRTVDLAALGERLGRLDVWWIAAAFLLATAQIVLVTLRWRAIIAQCGSYLSPVAALRISFIAAFFNQVLPSTVGGDAARVWMLGRKGGGWANAAYSVAIDRIAGVFVLALIVIACLPWTLNLVHDPIARALLLLIGLGAIGGAVLFMSIGVLRWRRLDRWAATRHLVEVSRITWRLCGAWRPLASIGAASFGNHLLTVLVAWCIGQSIAASASFAVLLLLIPPVLLVATVPLSIAGWGLRESSMIAAFTYAGLAQDDGLIVSVLFGIVTFAVGAVGGIAWIMGDKRLSDLTPKSGVSPSADGG